MYVADLFLEKNLSKQNKIKWQDNNHTVCLQWNTTVIQEAWTHLRTKSRHFKKNKKIKQCSLFWNLYLRSPLQKLLYYFMWIQIYIEQNLILCVYYPLKNCSVVNIYIIYTSGSQSAALLYRKQLQLSLSWLPFRSIVFECHLEDTKSKNSVYCDSCFIYFTFFYSFFLMKMQRSICQTYSLPRIKIFPQEQQKLNTELNARKTLTFIL